MFFHSAQPKQAQVVTASIRTNGKRAPKTIDHFLCHAKLCRLSPDVGMGSWGVNLKVRMISDEDDPVWRGLVERWQVVAHRNPARPFSDPGRPETVPDGY